jgi:thiopurine S-methyltransferase
VDANFWHERWEQDKIPFHESEANALLVKHLGALSLAPGARLFLPLCGKTLDIPWLLSKGYRVAGAELSGIAIRALFDGLGVTPQVRRVGEMDHYSAPAIDIFGGDIFALSQKILGPVDAIYDRAALVALPEEMRFRYSAHLMEITGRTRQLLVVYEYDQSLMNGPPFSVASEEVQRHYRDLYRVTLLESNAILGGLKGFPALENVWLLD